MTTSNKGAMSGMTVCWRRWNWKLALASWLAIGGAYASSLHCASAQITPDATLPNNSRVTTQGNIRIIEGGTQAGSNLFHSFEQFSVPNGSTAYFNNALDIQNIISRVTGKSISNIEGTLRANGTANLFLINPNGIIFGKDASLNVGGSFVGTTANAIQFGTQGFFSATNPEAPSPLLTINPSALLFNQIVAGASIQNSSTAPAGVAPTGVNTSGLRVPDGKNLLLVGGDITIDSGRLRAYGGLVELGGLATSGTVELGVDGNNISLSFPTESTRTSVSLINGANVNVWAGGGGSITVNASNLNITGGSSLIAGIAPSLGSVGAKAGDITLNATGDIKIDRGSITNNVEQQGIGNGGNITLSSNSLSLTNRAQLAAITFGQGNVGNVIINATNSVSLDGRSTIFSTVGTRSDTPEQRNAIKGNGGNIQITTPQLSLTNGAQLAAGTFGQGDVGNVIINATNSVSLDGSGSIIFSSVGDRFDSPEQRNAIKGNGGNIQITTPQLSLTNGAALVASTLGQGDAGNVIINATNSVSLDGSYTNSNGQSFVTGIFSTVGNVYDSPEQRNAIKGNGGNIQITTLQLSLTNGAQLLASTYGQGNAGNVTVNALDGVSLTDATIFSTVEAGGVGKGGNIDINAATLSLKDGAVLNTFTREASDTQPAGRGDAGNVNVKVSGSVDITGEKNGFPSGIRSKVGTGIQGNGGNITIDSGSFSLRDGGLLTAETLGQGNAGTIKVNAGANVTISGKSSNFNSGLYVYSQSTTGTAGDITVTSPRVTLDNGGTLDAQSGLGNGGDINLQTDLLFLRRGAQISTTAGTAQAGGDGGNITINAPNGFIVAGARENSDITANAYSGSGGRVTINATGIYGMTVRTREDLVRLLGTNLEPQLLPTNDITAISQTSSTLNGTVTVNTPDVDPNSGLVNLPAVPVDTQVAQGCTAGGAQAQSSFIITARGGLPPNPGEALSTDAVQVDLITLNSEVDKRSTTAVSTTPTSPTPPPIVEATGWVIDANGDIILTANAPTVTPHSSWQTPTKCSAPKPS
ncbi:S-layer family protein [Scytonema sp. PRP1]|uniref:S-layer family protein n=1 Tax=Scytonema sp. PRP1 TaxID=3120513 RepID=UPI00300D9AE3